MEGPELFRQLQGSYGTVVLHGSPKRFDIVEPRQCTVESTNAALTRCGIYGSVYAPLSLLYALIHEDRNNWGWRVDFEKEAAIRVVGHSLKSGPGFLYVLPKEPFVEDIGDGVCCAAFEPVQPLQVLEVDLAVLDYLQKYFGVTFRTPLTA